MVLWAAEREVSEEQARELVAGRFPGLDVERVEPLGVGWDNTAFLVNGCWVFRFPRREAAVPLLRQELRVLPLIAGRLPLAIPVPRFVGEPSADYPWPYVGTPLVPGREFGGAGLGAQARTRTAAGLAEFLAALHRLDVPGLPLDPNGRTDPVDRAEKTRVSLASLERQGLYRPDPAVEELLDGARAPRGLAPVTCHGDLHLRHLIVADDGRPSGVIDWGDLCRADPAVDLSLAYAAFAGRARAVFEERYGTIPPDRERVARILAVWLCALLADYAADQGDRALLAESLAGIGRAAR